jgi:hypothetical protein
MTGENDILLSEEYEAKTGDAWSVYAEQYYERYMGTKFDFF